MWFIDTIKIIKWFFYQSMDVFENICFFLICSHFKTFFNKTYAFFIVV